MDPAKSAVAEFWEAASCGEVYARGTDDEERFGSHADSRYRLEPYIHDFARFAQGRDLDVLEVGVGMGADHVEWARHEPRSLTGVDFTPRAAAWTRDRIDVHGLDSSVLVADAEQLPFADDSYDLVYSWGVLHHTPGTRLAFQEVHRVLRPGGRARIMIYHSRSIVGYLLWARYGLAKGRPTTSLREVYANHLESPGTQAFTVEEALRLASDFETVETRVSLSMGDLLQGAVGQQHSSGALAIAKKLWPRALIRRLLPRHGLMLLIDAQK